MTKFLVVDSYAGNDEIVLDTMEDVFSYLKDEEVADRSYPGDRPTVYEIVREVKYDSRPTEFFVVNDSPAANIPAPNPGETVTDYAKRITAG